MKEKLPSFENNNSPEIEFALDRSGEKVEDVRKSSEKQKTYSEKDLEKLKEKARKEARSTEDLLPEKSVEFTHAGHHKRSKPNPNSALKQARSRLSPSERQFSKVVHNPTIETVSDIAGGSIARPSGLLWGGVFSFFGSLIILIACRYYGYEYNYFVAFIGFVGGFVAGLVIESAWKLLTAKTSRS